VSWGGIGLGGVIVGKWLFDHWTTDNTQDSPVDENSKPLSEQVLRSRAREITVKVIEGDRWGSGILIQREGDLYTVLTNAHVIFSQADPTNYKIETPDGKVYVATVREDITFPQKEDLALLNFRSPQSQYQIAVFGDSSQLQPEDSIIATGFPFPTNQTEEPGWKLTQGEVWMLLDRALQEGYQLGYTGQIERGMSGGPILNLKGEVIGINGIDAYPLWERPYIYLEGGEPNLALQQKMDRYNWGIPAHTITQLLPELVVVSSAD
jgi:S1-C subfamily serine protease